MTKTNASAALARGPGFFGTTVLVAAAVWVCAPSPGQAQPPTEATAAAPPPATVTAESLEASRKAAAEAPDLDAETRQKIDALYVQALEGLKRVGSLRTRTAEFRRDADSVPQRMAELKARLNSLRSRVPTDPIEAPLAELEQELSRQEADLARLRTAQAAAEAERANRVARRREIRARLLALPEAMAALQKEMDTPPQTEIPLLAAAIRAEALVRKMILNEESPALQNEISKYDAEDAANFVQLSLDVRTEEVRFAESQLARLQQAVQRERSLAGSELIRSAEQLLSSAPVPLQPAAAENLDLAKAAQTLTRPISETQKNVESLRRELEDLRRRFTLTQQRVDSIGLTASVGSMLRRQRSELPDLNARRRSLRDRRDVIEDAQYALFEYDDQRSGLPQPADFVDSVLSDGNVSATPELSESLLPAAESVLAERREILDQIIRNSNTYVDQLFELDITEQLLIQETERYISFIDERVLWVRSNRTLYSEFAVDRGDFRLLEPESWEELRSLFIKDFRTNLPLYLLVLIAIAVLIRNKPRMRRELIELGQEAQRATCFTFAPTWGVAVRTFILSATWPGVTMFVAWRMLVGSNSTVFTTAIARALIATVCVALPLELLSRVCCAGGLADAHFRWPATTVRVLRGHLRWFQAFALPLIFVTTGLYAGEQEHGSDSVERIAFVVTTLILAGFLQRVLKPSSGIFRDYFERNRNGWLDRLKSVLHWFSVLAPLILAVLTIVGFYYTAQQLAWRFYATIVLVVTMQLAYSLLHRWLLIHRRRMSIEQRRAALADRAAQSAGDAEPSAVRTIEQLALVEPKRADVAETSEQSRRLIRTALTALSVVGLWMIWVDVLPALRLLDQWPLWTTTVTESVAPLGDLMPPANGAAAATSGEATVPVSREVPKNVTVANLLLALLIGSVTVVCARNIPGLMEISLLQRLPLDNSIRYAITTLTSYMIILLGVILGFRAISVGWSTVQWLATALTFGLAFGLQEIFANFVAGLILLFERPLRVGDVVTVDDVTGIVSRIRIRATTITNWDRKEYVIPNKEFITGRMLNWTLSDQVNRVVIEVGIAYGSNVQQAKDLLLGICGDHPATLEEPPTIVTFEGFGDNSLNLVVRTFLPNLERRLVVIDELYFAINDAFAAAGIEIAFPQRDLHLRSVDADVLNKFRQTATVE